jgi:hypothetical protein
MVRPSYSQVSQCLSRYFTMVQTNARTAQAPHFITSAIIRKLGAAWTWLVTSLLITL